MVVYIISFANFRASVTPLYLMSKILKLSGNIKLMNFLYIIDNIKGNLPCVFNNTFQFNLHIYYTRSLPIQNEFTKSKNRSIWYKKYIHVRPRFPNIWNLDVSNKCVKCLPYTLNIDYYFYIEHGVHAIFVFQTLI